MSGRTGNNGRLWRIRTEAAGGNPVQDVRYSYDGVGNVTATHEVPRQISGTLGVTLTDSFDSFDSTRWQTDSAYVAIPYNDSGRNVAKISGAGDPVVWGKGITRTAYSLLSAMGAQVRFRVDLTSTQFLLALENNDATYRRIAV